jgi:divalent metal cation (Fe/Co/Zn/Cd) transporter
LENLELRKIYHQTERLTLVVLLISLPAFGIVYLYQSSGSLPNSFPKSSGFLNGLLITFSSTVLFVQYWVFHRHIKESFSQEALIDKLKIYSKATKQRFGFLFVVSICSAVGLFFTGNPVYTVIFAVALVFFSLAKPTPDRLARLMKLKKDDREILRDISRPE